MENNNKKNDNKKESSIGGVIAFIIGLLIIFGDGLGVSIFGIIVIAAVIGVIIYAGKAAKKRQETEGGTAQVTGDDIKYAAKTGFSKVITEAKKLAEYDNDEHDASDHEDIDHFSENLSDEEKRIRQLKSMLKNGIIDKEEYNILMKKYNL